MQLLRESRTKDGIRHKGLMPFTPAPSSNRASIQVLLLGMGLRHGVARKGVGPIVLAAAGRQHLQQL